MPRAGLEAFFLREWQRVSAWQILLQPLSWIFSTLMLLRRALFRARLLHTYRAPIPVIVIGNLSVGGTGKTPLVIALTNALQQKNHALAVVSRGYTKGRGVSDEAALIGVKTNAAVHVNVSRAQAVREALARRSDLTCIVADDGLQHLALARDIEIAVVDGARGFGNGFLLPAGPLREPISRLASVDCIVVNNTNMPETPRQLTSLAHIDKPIFSMRYGNECFSPLLGGAALGPEAFADFARDKRVAAVAGIGNPERFFAHLATLGQTLESRHPFPDHHAFTEADLRAIPADLIVMTEKDAVKCAGFADARLWTMQIEAILPDAFYAFITDRLAHVARP